MEYVCTVNSRSGFQSEPSHCLKLPLCYLDSYPSFLCPKLLTHACWAVSVRLNIINILLNAFLLCQIADIQNCPAGKNTSFSERWPEAQGDYMTNHECITERSRTRTHVFYMSFSKLTSSPLFYSIRLPK